MNSQQENIKCFGNLRSDDEFVGLPLSVLQNMLNHLTNVPVSARVHNLTKLLQNCCTHDEVENLLIQDVNMYRIPQEVKEYLDNGKSDMPKVIGKIDLRKD
jgi:hypothetical protein